MNSDTPSQVGSADIFRLHTLRIVFNAICQATVPEYVHHAHIATPTAAIRRLWHNRALSMRAFFKLSPTIKKACKADLTARITQVATNLAKVTTTQVSAATYDVIKFFRKPPARPVLMVTNPNGEVPKDKAEEADNIMQHFGTIMRAAKATFANHVRQDRKIYTKLSSMLSNIPRSAAAVVGALDLRPRLAKAKEQKGTWW